MTPEPEVPGPIDDPTLEIVHRPWSPWLPFIDKKGLFPEQGPHSGRIPYETPGTARPAVYEIARQKSGRGELEVLFLGKTTHRSQGVRNRLRDHYTIDDALYDRIVEMLIRRYVLLARFVRFNLDEVSEADRIEGALRTRLSAARYPWNGPV